MSLRLAILFVVMTGIAALPLGATIVHAAGPLETIVPKCINNNCTLCDLAKVAKNLLNVGIYIAVFISVIFFARAAFYALFSGGSAERYAQARRVFTNTVIGLFIAITGYLVIETMMRTLVDPNASWGPWNNFTC